VLRFRSFFCRHHEPVRGSGCKNAARPNASMSKLIFDLWATIAGRVSEMLKTVSEQRMTSFDPKLRHYYVPLAKLFLAASVALHEE